MPTLQFKGKNIIWNHHLSVPYHTLEEDKNLDVNPDLANGNLLIEGDNLVALKSLLPFYANKIKCIYIDPPYNTGNDLSENEGWVYNDNVNSPMIKEWLGKEVNRDDLTKHDKWLCMMTPRLNILRELLSDDGVIFISCDNIELYNLKLLLNEIFGEENFVGTFIWRKKEGGGQAKAEFITEHEYILVFKKSEKFEWFDEIIPLDSKGFKKEDEKGKYLQVKLAKWGNAARKEDREKMHFPIYTSEGKKVIPYAPDGNLGRWRVGKKTMDELFRDDLVEFIEQDGKFIAYEKIYYSDDMVKVLKERSIIYELANTSDGTNALTELFNRKDVFGNPKPVELIKYFLTYTTKKDSIILDSFAGSGTTGQSVMDLNAEDKGKRKFILVQMKEDTVKNPKKNVCKDITRERLRKAIQKYKYKSGFKYLKIGTPLDAESLLDGDLPKYNQFAKYVYYLYSGENLENDKNIDSNNYFVGKSGSSVIYLIYENDYEKLTKLALNLSLAEKFKKENPNKNIVVYAPACFLDEEFMQENRISFVSIPYNLFQKNI